MLAKNFAVWYISNPTPSRPPSAPATRPTRLRTARPPLRPPPRAGQRHREAPWTMKVIRELQLFRKHCKTKIHVFFEQFFWFFLFRFSDFFFKIVKILILIFDFFSSNSRVPISLGRGRLQYILRLFRPAGIRPQNWNLENHCDGLQKKKSGFVIFFLRKSQIFFCSKVLKFKSQFSIFFVQISVFLLFKFLIPN